MTARTPCHVTGCRRTRPAHPIDTEWLCAKHWALVPLRRRQAYLRAKRQRKPDAVLVRLWSRCTAQAEAENFTGGWK